MYKGRLKSSWADYDAMVELDQMCGGGGWGFNIVSPATDFF